MTPRALRLREPLLVGGVVVAGLAWTGLVSPYTPGRHLPCPLYLATGTYCAGCGALRATHSLLRGDLAGAWDMNPLWVLVAPVLVGLWAAWVARAWRGGARLRVPAWTAWATGALIVGYSVLRNVPALAPWLAPGG